MYFRVNLDVMRGNKETDDFLKLFFAHINSEQLDKLVKDQQPLKEVKYTAVPQAEGRGQQSAETVP